MWVNSKQVQFSPLLLACFTNSFIEHIALLGYNLCDMKNRNTRKEGLTKLINIVTILLVGCLGIAGFMVMNQTAESNKVTADIAKIQSEHKSRVIQEVALLTAEMRNLQKDMDEILELIKEIEKAEKEKK